MQNFDNEKYLAYIKYYGDLVSEGYMDARKSAEVILGIDEIFRYFLYQLNEDLKDVEIEIPVKIRKGSWEALIPNDIEGWIKTALAFSFTAYASSAFAKMGENDFKDIGLKDVLRKVVKSIKWVVKISTHFKSTSIKEFKNVKFKEENSIMMVGLINEEGELLFVPQEYVELYKKCPDKLFVKITKSIKEGRELEIGFNPIDALDNDDTNGSVKIRVNEKEIFYKANDDDTVLFPELLHNQYVELNGRITRGNENSNTIGFKYMEHILTCIPKSGNIKEFKEKMFSACIIRGFVDRMSEDGRLNEKKPKIKIIDIINIKDENNLSLF